MTDSHRRTRLLALKRSAEERFRQGDLNGALACFTTLCETPDLDLCGMKRWAILQNRAIIHLTADRLSEAYKDITECIRLAEADTSASSSSGLAQACEIKEDIEGRMRSAGTKRSASSGAEHSKAPAAPLASPSAPTEDGSVRDGTNSGLDFKEWNAFQTQMAMLARTGASSVGEFEHLLRGASGWQRKCIARALGAVKPVKSPLLRCLERLLTDADEDVREMACEALGKVGNQAGFRSVDDYMFLGPLASLRRFGVRRIRNRCRRALRRVLSDKSQAVRTAAERAIARVDDSSEA